VLCRNTELTENYFFQKVKTKKLKNKIDNFFGLSNILNFNEMALAKYFWACDLPSLSVQCAQFIYCNQVIH